MLLLTSIRLMDRMGSVGLLVKPTKSVRGSRNPRIKGVILKIDDGPWKASRAEYFWGRRKFLLLIKSKGE